VSRAARFELNLGRDGDASGKRTPFRGGNTDARALDRLGREMHLVLVLAMTSLVGVAALAGVPTFLGMTCGAAAPLVAGRGYQRK
jgi:hypothetical protein